MIPLADENPTRTKPYIVYILVALNVLAYLVDRVGARGPVDNLYNWALVPRYLVYGDHVTNVFRMVAGNVVQAVPVTYTGLEPRWITIFTSMFMHGGLLHIAGNMLYLWIFGNNIEDALGHVKFVLFYLACGAAAAFAQVASGPGSPVPMVGASGAIAGVLGAYLLLYPTHTIRTLVLLGFFWTFVDVPALIVLGVWFLYQLLGLGRSGGTIGGGVAYWAHVGGFVAGLLLILLLGGRRLRGNSRRLHRYDGGRPYPWRPWS